MAHTLGPFTATDGRRFWFDFYKITLLVSLYLAGDTEPALLFHVPEFPHLHGRAPKVSDIIRLFRRRTYSLSSGTVWVRANLLAAAAPAGGYVGLRAQGGEITCTPPPVDVGGKLTIPAGGSCQVQLQLQAPDPLPAHAGPAGVDAAKASLSLPAEFSFRVQAGQAAILGLSPAEWTLYGQHTRFEWQAGPAPIYEAALLAVLIPLKCTRDRFRVSSAKSPYATPGGTAQIQHAAWALPVAQIDVANPTDASGGGGLVAQTGPGLALRWRGLRDGPISLPAPWIGLWPGLIAIVDFKASNLYARQHFSLWKDQTSKFRSSIDLRYTDGFPVFYVAAWTAEVLLAQANSEARLDRPVDVQGTPLPIRTLDSLLALAWTDAHAYVSLYDDNILIDSLDPQAHWPVEPGRAVSLAIRNALFTISPVNSLLLFGELRTEEMVEKATLLLGMGLFGILPTLPDPYAANVGWLRQLNRMYQRRHLPQLLLVAAVTWTKAAVDEDPDQVATAFAFAPLGAQEGTIYDWAKAVDQAQSFNQALVDEQPAPVAPDFSASDPASGQAQFLFAAAAEGPQLNEPAWRRRMAALEQEQFALLDVSTNADQMGVSFAWFNARALEDRESIFYEVYRPKGSASPPSGAFPLHVRELDLSAESRFVRAFTVPLVSWEPLLNVSPIPVITGDPPKGWNFYPNDGGPSRLFNDSVELVPIAPLPVTDFLVKDFHDRKTGFTGALFTLPFGLRAFAEFSRVNQFNPPPPDPPVPPAAVERNQLPFEKGALTGALQIRVDAPPHPRQGPMFKGGTFQLNNVVGLGGNPTGGSTLGHDVSEIFNNEFFTGVTTPGWSPRGVPLSRIDFCGYGASTFSHWQNPDAAVAETSKAYFDIWVGRTGEEVIQVKSMIYGLGIHVVRTITMLRAGDGYVFRYDTGWQPQSDGEYDFRYWPYNSALKPQPHASPYEFHPGIVQAVRHIRNIQDTEDFPPFKRTWHKVEGDTYIDDNDILQTLGKGETRDVEVELQPVYFDGDVEIEGVITGAVNRLVPSKKMLGYIQLKPKGEPISPALFAELLATQGGSIGGPVDCVIDVGRSGQHMRLSRVDVTASLDTKGQPIFVSAGRGSLVLPKETSWTVVQHNQGTGEVSPLDPLSTVPLIRRGKLSIDPATGARSNDVAGNDWLRVANPMELVRAPVAGSVNYGLLQSTVTQKLLFRKPAFQQLLPGPGGVVPPKVDQLFSDPPDFADAYRLVNTKGIFPNVADAAQLDLGTFETKILEAGYKLVDKLDPPKLFEQILPPGPLYLINEDFLKLYVEYPSVKSLVYGFDSSAADPGQQWLSKMSDVAMVVDLASMQRLLIIKGKFDTEKGKDPAFVGPELSYGPDLEPVVQILEILEQLSTAGYSGAFGKGLEMAMSNSADSWTYAFHARKEIPLIQFPPGDAYNQPETPLKLQASLAVGVYFNEALQIPSSPSQLIPSAGAFLEFNGSLSVMCVSLGLGSIYATGAVDLRIAADIKTGPSLHMKFGFGAEIVVGLPVVGSVSLTYMVGVEINLDTGHVAGAGLLTFKGRAEILGGLVTVSILIEAKGMVDQIFSPQKETDLIAQVTFGLDISIFLVIDISFSESWQERRQIA